MPQRSTKTAWMGFALASVLGMALSGCSDTGDTSPDLGLRKDPNVNLQWPAAPQVTRIEYINSLQTDSSWVDAQDHDLDATKAVALDSSGDILYAVDRTGVKVVNTATGEFSSFATDVADPQDVAVAQDGRVFISDADEGAVLVYSADDNFLSRIDGFANPQGLAIDDARGRLYVADSAANSVTAFDLFGRKLFDLESSMGLPLDVAVNSAGNVYVVNWDMNARIHVFDEDGIFLRGFGERGTFPTQFISPKGIAIDSDDNVYVTDAAFGNVQVFDNQDRLAIWFGEGGGDPGQFNLPGKMEIDSKDRIFVPEFGTNRVQIFQYISI